MSSASTTDQSTPPSGPSTEITRLAEKGSTDRGALYQLLDTVHLGHFAVVVDGHPVVIPTAVARDGDRVLAHGSTGSPWMRALAAGAPTSLAVTGVDGLVVARSAFESSILYRSAVLFGRCAPVDDKRRALDLMTEALIPGRTAELRAPNGKELAATLVLALPIEQWSLKIGDGWPEDPPEDVADDAWAGVVAASVSYGTVSAAPDLRDGIAVPASVRALATRTTF